MPKGKTEKGAASTEEGQVASYAGTLMKNGDEGSGSRDPALQKAIEEPVKALHSLIKKQTVLKKEISDKARETLKSPNWHSETETLITFI